MTCRWHVSSNTRLQQLLRHCLLRLRELLSVLDCLFMCVVHMCSCKRLCACALAAAQCKKLP